MIPLSFAQQRLWFLAELEGTDGSYNIPLAVRLRGRLDVQALHAAFVDLLGRHEVLRTVFPVADGVPRQHILKPDAVHVELSVIDLSEDEVAAAVREASLHHFDLSVDLPLRVQLLAIRPDDHVLVVVLHHIAADGWSMGLLAEDISVAYRGATGPPGSRLGATPRSVRRLHLVAAGAAR